MYNPNTYVYVPGDYFGKNIAEKFKIDTKNTLIIGCIIKTFNMSSYKWHQVYWFLSNEKLWIDANHLTKLPLNSNIIDGKTYLTNLNRKNYEIKKDINYFYNILTNSFFETEENKKNNCQDEFRNNYSDQNILSNSSNIRYQYFA